MAHKKGQSTTSSGHREPRREKPSIGRIRRASPISPAISPYSPARHQAHPAQASASGTATSRLFALKDGTVQIRQRLTPPQSEYRAERQQKFLVPFQRSCGAGLRFSSTAARLTACKAPAASAPSVLGATPPGWIGKSPPPPAKPQAPNLRVQASRARPTAEGEDPDALIESYKEESRSTPAKAYWGCIWIFVAALIPFALCVLALYLYVSSHQPPAVR